jgi:gamma-glutamyltranspeptidase/glutathione hydrolase
MGADWRGRAGARFVTSKEEVVASRLVVATNHPLASAAGLEVYARGGNAVDAAVAAAFALTVVEPMMVSIFGAGMIVLRDGATGEIVNVDNYACAPAAATPDTYRPVHAAGDPGAAGNGDPFATEGRENAVGYRAVGVPGALQAWTALLAERGRLPLAQVMAPAVRAAAEGFEVSPYLAHCTSQSAADLAAFPASAEVFLPEDRPLRIGERLVRRDYAGTLERIAADGPEAFTHGPIAEAVAADMARNGGLITVEDLAAYRWHRRAPVRGTYRGYEIVSAAPTSSGGTHIVQALNILEGFDVRGMGFGTVESIHLLAETLKICFADRAAYVGDPAVVDVPLAWLMSKDYAAERRREIDVARARSMAAGQRPDGPPPQSGAALANESANTTHLTVMDGDGTIVCMTQTLNTLFGSKVTVPDTGMLLNNCMMLFDPRPGGPNSVAPGKRMLSSMSPTIVLKDGRPAFALGTPGGTRIFPAVLQGIVNVVDHGMSLQEAVEAPRVWTQGGALEVEQAIPETVRAGLRDRGHEVKPVPRVAGGMNGVLVDPETGRLRGAACWRADGTAVGMSGGYTDRVGAPGVPV